MQTQNLFQPFNIHAFASDECPMRTHRHNFYELVYIVSGKGQHVIEGNNYPYYADNLFLLLPMEAHHFVVEEFTSFVFVSFNNIYLKGQQTGNEQDILGQWAQKLEYVFQNARHEGCVIRDPADKPLVRTLIDAIRREYTESLHRDLLLQLINTLLTIVAKNIDGNETGKMRGADNTVIRIIDYIHQNIYQPEKLRAEQLASHFNISLNYIGEYFRKQTGETLQQYIIQYKISLVETRLRYSDKRLGDIAFELGFTDESHLTKTFRKYKGQTPTQYRKNVQTPAQTAA